MICPICKTNTMNRCRLDDGPLAYRCNRCEGVWVGLADYEEWMLGRTVESEQPQTVSDFALQEENLAKLCPTCRQLMFKYRVRQYIQFHVDHCRGCGGMWFDKGEWEALASAKLHDELPKIFTQRWQKEIKQLDQRATFAKMYRERFGADEYQRLKDTRAWIEAHPHKDLLHSYLACPDPYQA